MLASNNSCDFLLLGLKLAANLSNILSNLELLYASSLPFLANTPATLPAP